jgi:hypothetical protein
MRPWIIKSMRSGRLAPAPPSRPRMAHARHSLPDSGFGSQVEVVESLSGVPSWLGSGFGGTLKELATRAPQVTTLEATQGQIHGSLHQLTYKCHQNRVETVGC